MKAMHRATAPDASKPIRHSPIICISGGRQGLGVKWRLLGCTGATSNSSGAVPASTFFKQGEALGSPRTGGQNGLATSELSRNPAPPPSIPSGIANAAAAAAAVAAVAATAANSKNIHLSAKYRPFMDAWDKGFEFNARDEPWGVWLQVTEGSLPPELIGTYFRNGPGRFRRGPDAHRHPYDGDGLVTSVAFRGDGSAFFRSAFVRTLEHEAEDLAGRLLFRGALGTRRRGGLLGNAVDLTLRNAANTGVVLQGQRLLALYPGGLPYALDPATLTTRGPDLLSGALTPGLPLSFGHPAADRLLTRLNRALGNNVRLPPPHTTLGGEACTARPRTCGATGRRVFWSLRHVAAGMPEEGSAAADDAGAWLGAAVAWAVRPAAEQFDTVVTFWEVDPSAEDDGEEELWAGGQGAQGVMEGQGQQQQEDDKREAAAQAQAQAQAMLWQMQVREGQVAGQAAQLAAGVQPAERLEGQAESVGWLEAAQGQEAAAALGDGCGGQVEEPRGPAHGPAAAKAAVTGGSGQQGANTHSEAEAGERKQGHQHAPTATQLPALAPAAAAAASAFLEEEENGGTAVDGGVSCESAGGGDGVDGAAGRAVAAAGAGHGGDSRRKGLRLRYSLQGFATVPDVAVTANYYLLLQPPVHVESVPYILGETGPAACLRWREGEETVLHVIPRPGSEAERRGEQPLQLPLESPCCALHHINAFELDNHSQLPSGASRPVVVLDSVVYDSWPAVGAQPLPEQVGRLVDPDVGCKGRLQRMHVDLTATSVRTSVPAPGPNRHFELPAFNTAFTGCRHRYVYGCSVVFEDASCGVVKADMDTLQLQRWSPGPGYICLEPCFVPRLPPNAARPAVGGGVPRRQPLSAPSQQSRSNQQQQQQLPPAMQGRQRGEDDGWLVCYGFDSTQRRSELLVFDAWGLAAGPVARLALPEPLPHGLYGTWADTYFGPQQRQQ